MAIEVFAAGWDLEIQREGSGALPAGVQGIRNLPVVHPGATEWGA